MDSRSFTRNLPSTAGNQSIYEAIKLHDQHPAATVGDEDENALDDAQIDEDNLEARFQDQDLDALLADAEKSIPGSATISRAEQLPRSQPVTLEPTKSPTGSLRWTGPNGPYTDEGNDVPTSLLMEDAATTDPAGGKRSDERPSKSTVEKAAWARTSRDKTPQRDDEVPASLLLGANDAANPEPLRHLPPRPSETLPPPVPGPMGTDRPRVRWNSNQEGPARRNLREPYQRRDFLYTNSAPMITDPADRAMWMWANVENLDNFLAEVYEYFRGKGIWSILLAKLYEQLTFAFVVSLAVFLTSCVDYRELPGSKHMSDIKIPRCTSRMSGLSSLFLWLLSFFWLFKTFRIFVSVKRLWSMHEFFHHALRVTENELQTITWQTIVSQIMSLRDANARTALEIQPRSRRFIGEQSRQRMDAHDIANRLMRRDNYLIALFNKDVLNLTLPVPILNNRQLFSRNLEWSINLCVLDYVFNESGQVSQLFLRDSHRHELIDGLRRRFFIMGFISIISAPFLVSYFLTIYFLRYFTEFQKNPSQIGSRSYTPLAEWKFREFNELYNFFERRLNMSKPFANRYLDQFPKDKISQTARFVAFVAGSLTSVLGAASLLDPDVFLGFEITPERTVLFYLGLFGTIWAVARGLVAEDEDSVFDPEYAITNVADYTRFMPSHWRGRLHTEDVRKEFAQLYQMKIIIFLEEILSIVFTPFVLWFSLPDCSPRIVDFFREFTVHVDGLGYVCSFALFEFQKDGVGNNSGTGARLTKQAKSADEHGNRHRADARKDYYSTKDNKMLSSYYSFIDSYGNNPASKAFNRAHDRRIFRPPPAFPSIHEETTVVEHHADSEVKRPAHRSFEETTKSKHPRTRRDGKTLTPSLLLDPTHQPSRSLLHLDASRHSRHLHERSKPPTSAVVDSLHERPLESIALHEDESLCDSWRTSRAVDDDGAERGTSNDEHQMNDYGDGGGDAGVLGLLYEYQRAQTEGRGRGGIGV
ncbi:MAG: hypothetical protein Q9162_006118 [Coniocarpon cinnabarinum]